MKDSEEGVGALRMRQWDRCCNAKVRGLFACVAAQPIGVPGAVSALNDRSRITEGIRRTWLTLLRGDRARTNGDDDGQSNRGLGEHGGISRFEFVTPSWCKGTLGMRYQVKCEVVHNRKLF